MFGYLGPVGTFSYMAVNLYTNNSKDIKEYSSIYKLIKAVHDGEIDSAVVPIENSIEGSVTSTLDMLASEEGLYICGEITLKVCENLIAKKGAKQENIKKIISHPQPIGQCQGMINECFPDVLIEYTESTAAAAKYISKNEDMGIAMIGPSACADIYGLEILKKDCGDEKHNSTRFVELRKTQNQNNMIDAKTSLVFATEHKPGALYNILKIFSENNINMLKIESRPDKKGMGTYIFFIDIQGSIFDGRIADAWKQVKEKTIFARCLGSYEKS